MSRCSNALMLIACLAGCGVIAGYVAAAESPPRLTVVTTSSHCDWQWGNSRAWHAERYAQAIRQVLLLMRDHPHYVWQLENVNEELLPFLEKARTAWPELVAEFWQRVREGRIEIIVAISNPRISEVYPETFVRNLVLGKAYFRRHAPGVALRAYHAVDLMSGHSQVPQLLAAADYEYFLFSRPAAKRAVFWRVGLDGTRMLSACQHYGFGGLQAGGIELTSKSGDDILPDPKLAKEAERWNPQNKVLSTSVRFFDEVARSGAQLPELAGVLDSLESYSSCGSGVHGSRNLYLLNNQHEDLLVCAEKAQALASLRGGAFPQKAMDGLWLDLLSCAGHAILWSWAPDYAERLEKAQATRIAAERAVTEALASIARGIHFQPDAGTPLVVFNSHAWPVTGPAECELAGDAPATLRDASGRTVPLQTLEGTAPGGARRAAFVAENVPPCGYRTYHLTAGPADRGPGSPSKQDGSEDRVPADARRTLSGAGTIENEFFRAELDAQGQMLLHDKSRGLRLGEPQAGELGAVVFRPAPVPTDWSMNGPLGPPQRWETSRAAATVVAGPVFAAIRSAGHLGPHRLVREVRLWRGCRRIEYRVDIEAGAGCGVFCLRFPGLRGRVSAGIPFGVEPRDDPEKEPFRGEFFAQGYPEGYYATRWTDVSTDQAGCTFICPPGMHTGYAYRRGEQALEHLLHRVRPMPKGVWGQVHPSLQGTGKHSYRCALVPHAGTWREALSFREAVEFHTPLVAFSPDRDRLGTAAPKTPPTTAPATGETMSLVEVTPPGVMLSALRLVDPQPDGGASGWEVRLYETLGRPAQAVLRFACPIRSAQLTNLLGESARGPQAVEVRDREVRLPLGPWKIATLRIVGQP